MGLTNALNNKPIRTLGFITALHSLVYGAGYLSGWGGFNGALVGLAVNNTPLTTALGTVLTLVGGFLMFAYARMNPNTIHYVSNAQTAVWFFITLMYLINGAWLLALGVGFTWTIISAYIAFASKNRIDIIRYDQTDQAREDTANEDQRGW